MCYMYDGCACSACSVPTKAVQPLMYWYFCLTKPLNLKPRMQLGILTTLSIILCGKLVKSSCIYAKDVNLVLTSKGWDDILEDLFSEETTIN